MLLRQLHQFAAASRGQNRAATLVRRFHGRQRFFRIPSQRQRHHQHVLAARPMGQIIIAVQNNRQRAERRCVRAEKVSPLDGSANACQDNPAVLPDGRHGQSQAHPVSILKLRCQGVDPTQQVVRIEFAESFRMIQVKVKRHAILPNHFVAQGIAQVR